MLQALGDLRIDTPKVLFGALAVSLVLLAVPVARRLSRRRVVLLIAVPLAAGLLGLAAVWLVGDVLDVFNFTFTATFRLWVALAFAGIAFAVVSLVGAGVWRSIVVAVSIVSVLLTSCLFINADFGEYSTVGDIVGPRAVPAFSEPAAAGTADVSAPDFLRTWTPPAGMPDTGSLGHVTIPATLSAFPARQAVVYLPPAARVSSPPKLPVMVMLSGQPGEPDDLFAKGGLQKTLDHYAAEHHGLAPIVVVPDQLADPAKNPMCVDSPLGHSATYITKDVTDWISANLPVTPDHRYWGIGGFSQGATCTTQFGPAHPDLYRTWFDIAGEIAPTIGEATVREGFGGDEAAYDAAKPISILERNAPYHDVEAIVGFGALDTRLGPETRQVEAAMKEAGVATTEIVSPGTAHDWNTVTYVFEHGIPLLGKRLGLEAS